MTPGEFIAKWRASELKERSAAQEHFIDLCRLLGEPTPAEADPTGEHYCFERGARKDTGGDGWADVWKRHCFAWEYKGRRADLDTAFNQLRQYALALENPPLLIVSDMARFRIRTNWTNSVSLTHEFEVQRCPFEPGDVPQRGPSDQRDPGFVAHRGAHALRALPQHPLVQLHHPIAQHGGECWPPSAFLFLLRVHSPACSCHVRILSFR